MYGVAGSRLGEDDWSVPSLWWKIPVTSARRMPPGKASGAIRKR